MYPFSTMPSFSAALSQTHLSYYSIPVAYLLAFIPHVYANTIAGKNYDLATPRKLEGTSAQDNNLDKQVLHRIHRAKAAHDNAIETIGLYAAGVVAATVAGVDRESLNMLSVAYLVLRATYNIIYVGLQNNRKWAPLRSLSWIGGMGVIFTLWIKAGNMMN